MKEQAALSEKGGLFFIPSWRARSNVPSKIPYCILDANMHNGDGNIFFKYR